MTLPTTIPTPSIEYPVQRASTAESLLHSPASSRALTPDDFPKHDRAGAATLIPSPSESTHRGFLPEVRVENRSVDPAGGEIRIPDRDASGPSNEGTTSAECAGPLSSTPLRAKDAAEYARRVRIVERWIEARAQGQTMTAVAIRMRVSVATLCRWAQAYETDGPEALAPGWHRCGRTPDYTPTDYEIAQVRAVYVRLCESRVRGKGRGSSRVAAFRLVASSDDGRITAAFRQTVLRRESRSLPPSWERLLETPSSVLSYGRDRKSLSGYISTPRGMHYIDADGNERPLRAGTLFESDDGTVNFPVCVPWPHGGDPCSDKWGVKIGRFQLLPIVDVRTRFCPLWHFVIRSKSSYRGEDIVALFGACFADVGMPEALRLERGSWESNIVRESLAMAGVQVITAWTSKQKNAVEGFFDRLWTPLSLAPRDVGRFRGEHAENTALLSQCEAGRRDPREHLLTVEQAVEQIGRAVSFLNGEPIESKTWGRWVPQALFEQQIAEQPLPRLPDHLRVFFSRERREWTVRKGAVGGKVETPTLSFPVWFQDSALWEFEGCVVRCFFDPFAPQVIGTLVLVDAWRGYPAGHVIARDVAALELPPQAVLAADWKDDAAERSLATRKAMAKAVRTESWHWRGGRRSEARDGFGNSAVRTVDAAGIVTTHARVAPTPATVPPAPTRSSTPAAEPQPKRQVSLTAADLSDLRELDPAPAQGRSSSGFAVSMEELRELD